MKYEIIDGDIPTVYATLNDMDQFSTFIERCEAEGIHKYGLFKVKPPKEWHPRPSDPQYKRIDEFRIKRTVIQSRHSIGSGTGCFIQDGKEDRKEYTAKDFQGVDFLGPPEANPQLNRDGFLESADTYYFKNLAHKKPLYGSDFTGTLFDDNIKEWNIQNLPSCLKLLDMMGVTIEGVNTPYLYFGSFGSTFPWHTEDMDMHSINYLHNVPNAQFPKRWWVIPPEEGNKFERLMVSRFPNEYKNCKVFWRHKTIIIPPKILSERNIKFYQTVHWPGEFMITCPYAYHMGYNLGPNVAESTNFATRRWIDYLKEATYCENCESRVYIYPKHFVKVFQPDEYREWKRRFEENSKKIEPPHLIYPPLKETTWKEDVESFVKSYNEKKRKKKAKWEDRTIEQILNPSGSNNSKTNKLKRKARSKTLNAKKRLRTEKSDKIPNEPVVDKDFNENQDDKMNFSAREKSLISRNDHDECLTHRPKSIERPSDQILSCQICSTLQNSLNNEVFPTQSVRFSETPPLIKEITFKCSAKYPKIKDLRSYMGTNQVEKPSKLLNCCICNLTVHALCYGVSEEAYSSNAIKQWKCEVCASTVRKAVCKICQQHGGALKIVTGSTRWAHVQCIMGTNGCYINYLHSNKFEIKVTEKDCRVQQKPCCYCGKVEFTIKCNNKDCKIKDYQETFFHLQCAANNNHYFKQGAFPNSLIVYCSECSKQHIQNKEFCFVHEGDHVFYENENGQFCEGKISSLTKEFMHRVYFVEEDELSDDISQKYITNHNWDSFPKLNQWVEVLWSDGKTYNGIYKGFRVANCYEISDIESKSNESQVLEQGVDVVKKIQECQLYELQKVANPSKVLQNFIKKKAATNYKEIMSSPKSKDKKASQSERLKLKEVKQESSIFQTHCSQKKKMQTKR